MMLVMYASLIEELTRIYKTLEQTLQFYRKKKYLVNIMHSTIEVLNIYNINITVLIEASHFIFFDSYNTLFIQKKNCRISLSR